jgi:hypothetical protein
VYAHDIHPRTPLPRPAFLTLYANGKSAVRVDAPGVRPLGPHFFTGNPSPRWGAPPPPPTHTHLVPTGVGMVALRL